MTRNEALRIRAQVEAGAAALPDAEASKEPSLTRPMYFNDKAIEAGTRVNFGGVLWRAAVTLWDREDSTPESAPTLWELVPYRDGIRIIPEVITAGLAFSYGELGWWGDILKRSIRPGEKTNVHTPDEAPELWEDYVAEEMPEEVTDA